MVRVGVDVGRGRRQEQESAEVLPPRKACRQHRFRWAMSIRRRFDDFQTIHAVAANLRVPCTLSGHPEIANDRYRVSRKRSARSTCWASDPVRPFRPATLR